MNWTKHWTHVTSTLALSAAVALPTVALGQQQQSDQQQQQQQQQQSQDQQPDEQANQQQQESQAEQNDNGDNQAKQEKQGDDRKLQVFQLEHRTPQQLSQIIALAEQAESDQEVNLATIGRFAHTAAPRHVAGYRGAPAATDQDQQNNMVMATDEQKKILFVRGSEDQLSKVKELVDAFDVEPKELKRQNIGKLSVVPVEQQDASQVRTTLSQLELDSGMLHMGEVTLIVFHNDGDQEKTAQAEQVIKVLCEEKKDKDKADKDNADKDKADKDADDKDKSDEEDSQSQQDESDDRQGDTTEV